MAHNHENTDEISQRESSLKLILFPGRRTCFGVLVLVVRNGEFAPFLGSTQADPSPASLREAK